MPKKKSEKKKTLEKLLRHSVSKSQAAKESGYATSTAASKIPKEEKEVSSEIEELGKKALSRVKAFLDSTELEEVKVGLETYYKHLHRNNPSINPEDPFIGGNSLEQAIKESKDELE